VKKVCVACGDPVPGDHTGAPRDGVRCHCRSFWLFGLERTWVVDYPKVWEGDQA
jgi:hypothetical protein